MAVDFRHALIAINALKRAISLGDAPVIAQAQKRLTDSINRNESAAMSYVRQHLYPPKRDGKKKFRFASEKQRRYFWYAVRKGLIHVPYQRTGRLREATRAKPVAISERGFTIAVEVDTAQAPYAEYVIGIRQLPGHGDTGWPRFSEAFGTLGAGYFAEEAGSAYTEALRGFIREEL